MQERQLNFVSVQRNREETKQKQQLNRRTLNADKDCRLLGPSSAQLRQPYSKPESIGRKDSVSDLSDGLGEELPVNQVKQS